MAATHAHTNTASRAVLHPFGLVRCVSNAIRALTERPAGRTYWRTHGRAAYTSEDAARTMAAPLPVLDRRTRRAG